LITIAASSDSNNVFFLRVVLPELAVLTSKPLIKDLGAFSRYALPNDSKAIGENLKQASRALKQGKSMIIVVLAESKKDHAIELLTKL
nr:hypothetical protein [Tanacetum cinerariifolium]